VLDALAKIFRNKENRSLFIDEEITPLLFNLINSSEIGIYQNSIALLCNICIDSSDEEKNNLIKSGIFNIYHKKLLEISPPPPENILSHNYYSVKCIISGIYNILNSNPSGVSSFLNTPLIPVLLQTLDSALTLTTTTSDNDIYNIQRCICNCFMYISSRSYNNVNLLVNPKIIDAMMNVIEKYISQIKENKTFLKKETAELGTIIIFNTTYKGVIESLSSEHNKFKKLFEDNNKLNRLLIIFEFLNSLKSITLLQKRITNRISISICYLFKNERILPSYNVVFSYIDKLRLSPHPTSGFDFPSNAQKAWNKIIRY
jgi:hypothetical protein